MSRIILPAALASAACFPLLLPTPAPAHGIAGARQSEYVVNVELAKRITEHFSLALNYGATVGLKIPTTGDPNSGADVSCNHGNNNASTGGLALPYSLRYIASQVENFGLPGWMNRLMLGVTYGGDTFQRAAELLIPLNAAAGTSIGFIAQFHLYFDDLFANSLGKPVVNW